MKLSKSRSLEEKRDEPVLHHVIKNGSATKQVKSYEKCLDENVIPPSPISLESKHKHGKACNLLKEKKSDKINAFTRNHKLKLKNKTASFPDATANIQKTSEQCSSVKSATRRLSLTKPIKRRCSYTGNDSSALKKVNIENSEKQVAKP